MTKTRKSYPFPSPEFFHGVYQDFLLDIDQKIKQDNCHLEDIEEWKDMAGLVGDKNLLFPAAYVNEIDCRLPSLKNPSLKNALQHWRQQFITLCRKNLTFTMTACANEIMYLMQHWQEEIFDLNEIQQQLSIYQEIITQPLLNDIKHICIQAVPDYHFQSEQEVIAVIELFFQKENKQVLDVLPQIIKQQHVKQQNKPSSCSFNPIHHLENIRKVALYASLITAAAANNEKKANSMANNATNPALNNSLANATLALQHQLALNADAKTSTEKLTLQISHQNKRDNAVEVIQESLIDEVFIRFQKRLFIGKSIPRIEIQRLLKKNNPTLAYSYDSEDPNWLNKNLQEYQEMADAIPDFKERLIAYLRLLELKPDHIPTWKKASSLIENKMKANDVVTGVAAYLLANSSNANRVKILEFIPNIVDIYRFGELCKGIENSERKLFPNKIPLRLIVLDQGESKHYQVANFVFNDHHLYLYKHIVLLKQNIEEAVEDTPEKMRFLLSINNNFDGESVYTLSKMININSEQGKLTLSSAYICAGLNGNIYYLHKYAELLLNIDDTLQKNAAVQLIRIAAYYGYAPASRKLAELQQNIKHKASDEWPDAIVYLLQASRQDPVNKHFDYTKISALFNEITRNLKNKLITQSYDNKQKQSLIPYGQYDPLKLKSYEKTLNKFSKYVQLYNIFSLQVSHVSNLYSLQLFSELLQKAPSAESLRLMGVDLFEHTDIDFSQVKETVTFFNLKKAFFPIARKPNSPLPEEINDLIKELSPHIMKSNIDKKLIMQGDPAAYMKLYNETPDTHPDKISTFKLFCINAIDLGLIEAYVMYVKRFGIDGDLLLSYSRQLAHYGLAIASMELAIYHEKHQQNELAGFFIEQAKTQAKDNQHLLNRVDVISQQISLVSKQSSIIRTVADLSWKFYATMLAIMMGVVFLFTKIPVWQRKKRIAENEKQKLERKQSKQQAAHQKATSNLQQLQQFFMLINHDLAINHQNNKCCTLSILKRESILVERLSLDSKIFLNVVKAFITKNMGVDAKLSESGMHYVLTIHHTHLLKLDCEEQANQLKKTLIECYEKEIQVQLEKTQDNIETNKQAIKSCLKKITEKQIEDILEEYNDKQQILKTKSGVGSELKNINQAIQHANSIKSFIELLTDKKQALEAIKLTSKTINEARQIIEQSSSLINQFNKKLEHLKSIKINTHSKTANSPTKETQKSSKNSSDDTSSENSPRKTFNSHHAPRKEKTSPEAKPSEKFRFNPKDKTTINTSFLNNSNSILTDDITREFFTYHKKLVIPDESVPGSMDICLFYVLQICRLYEKHDNEAVKTIMRTFGNLLIHNFFHINTRYFKEMIKVVTTCISESNKLDIDKISSSQLFQSLEQDKEKTISFHLSNTKQHITYMRQYLSNHQRETKSDKFEIPIYLRLVCIGENALQLATIAEYEAAQILSLIVCNKDHVVNSEELSKLQSIDKEKVANILDCQPGLIQVLVNNNAKPDSHDFSLSTLMRLQTLYLLYRCKNEYRHQLRHGNINFKWTDACELLDKLEKNQAILELIEKALITNQHNNNNNNNVLY